MMHHCICVNFYVIYQLVLVSALTSTVFGLNSISIVARLADFTVSSGCVAKAKEALARDCVAMSELTHIHVAVAVARDTDSSHYLWVTIVTSGTPAYTDTRV